MPDTSGPWDGNPWAEADWYRAMTQAVPSGVHGTAPATVATSGALAWSASGLTITLAAGRANVGGACLVRTAALTTVTATANTHATFNRMDRLVARRSLATHTVALVIIAGTAASTPVAPAITRDDTTFDLPLFSFLVPPASGTTLSGVVDERTWIDVPTGFIPAFGQMWRTSGFAAIMPADTATKISFDAARVSGGITWDDANDQLVLAADGFYRVTCRAYVTGGSGFPANGYVERVRASVANISVVQTSYYWKPTGGDVFPCVTALVPLKAGDRLQQMQLHNGNGSATYWGVNEYAGIQMTVEYVGPLNGATPI